MQIILISVKIKVWEIVFLLLYLDFSPQFILSFFFGNTTSCECHDLYHIEYFIILNFRGPLDLNQP